MASPSNLAMESVRLVQLLHLDGDDARFLENGLTQKNVNPGLLTMLNDRIEGHMKEGISRDPFDHLLPAARDVVNNENLNPERLEFLQGVTSSIEGTVGHGDDIRVKDLDDYCVGATAALPMLDTHQRTDRRDYRTVMHYAPEYGKTSSVPSAEGVKKTDEPLEKAGLTHRAAITSPLFSP